jgi:hypothetical protein
MATESIVCPECAEPVAPGRLSCPACGTLLAAVAGGSGPATVVIDGPTEPPLLEPDPTPPVVGAYVPFVPPVAEPSPEPSPDPAPDPAPDHAPDPAPDPATDTSAATDLGITTDRVEVVAGWFVGFGAGLSAVGFLLPWSRTVIGAESVGGYLDTWGLASQSHALPFLAALIVAAFAFARPRLIGSWLRSGVLGVTLGSLLLGLVWPYLLGPLGAELGVSVEGIAIVVLLVGGVAAIWAGRHARVAPPV